MATCAVSGTILDPAGEAISSVTVFARVLQPVFSGSSLVTPQEISAITDTSGNFVLTVQQSISVVFTIQYPIVGTEPMRTFNYTGNIPGAATATFSSIVVVE
jgi:hypothetical protein